MINIRDFKWTEGAERLNQKKKKLHTHGSHTTATRQSKHLNTQRDIGNKLEEIT